MVQTHSDQLTKEEAMLTKVKFRTGTFWLSVEGFCCCFGQKVSGNEIVNVSTKHVWVLLDGSPSQELSLIEKLKPFQNRTQILTTKLKG